MGTQFPGPDGPLGHERQAPVSQAGYAEAAVSFSEGLPTALPLPWEQSPATVHPAKLNFQRDSSH